VDVGGVVRVGDVDADLVPRCGRPLPRAVAGVLTGIRATGDRHVKTLAQVNQAISRGLEAALREPASLRFIGGMANAGPLRGRNEVMVNGADDVYVERKGRPI
jgi:hypothetical protein